MSLIKHLSSQLGRCLRSVNSSIGSLGLRIFQEKEGLIVLAFHGVVPDFAQVNDAELNPRYLVSLSEFERSLAYYLDLGFEAISPIDIVQGLKRGGRYLMVTFDDGYANNLLTVPILEKHKTPAVFAVVTDNVIEQKSFWWDIAYRHRARLTPHEINPQATVDRLIPQRPREIEDWLTEQLGSDAAGTPNDVARPMRPAEIRNLAGHPLVHWANHSSRHELLPSCNRDEVRQTVGKAQQELARWTGTAPICITYPFGGHDAMVRSVCRELGLKVGCSMASFKHPLSLNDENETQMKIPRFAINHGDSVERQCLETRIDWKPSWLLRGRPGTRVES